MTVIAWTRFGLVGRRLTDDPLARGASLLIGANLVGGILGLAFWAIAARTQDPRVVGAAAAFGAALGLGAAVAGLGLPETLVRHLPDATEPRAVILATARLMLLGGAIAGLVVALAPTAAPLDPSPFVRGAVGLVAGFALLAWSLGSSIALATRQTGLVFGGALVTGLVKVGLVLGVAAIGMTGAVPLALAATIGALIGAVYAIRGSLRRSPRLRVPVVQRAALRGLSGYAGANLIGGAASLAPTALAPWLLAIRGGPEAAAYGALPLMLLVLLNLPAAAIARSYFAEASHGQPATGLLVRRAVVVAVVLAACVNVGTIAAAPALLGLLGGHYAEQGVTLLRLLAVASLVAVPSYFADAVLNVRRDRVGYAVANVGGSLWLIGCLLVAAHSPVGLGTAWLVGQVGYLAIAGAIVLRRRSAVA